VPGNPEFIFGNVFVAHDAVIHVVDVHHGRKLFHLISLRIDAADGFDVENRPAEINRAQVVKGRRRHRKTLSHSKVI